jgi:antitoxin component YwqK of YwqJK toxin-antitoxin module
MEKKEEVIVQYYDSGKKESEIHMKDGLYDGVSTSWYESGNKKAETLYKNDTLKMDTFWFENGTKKYEIHYAEEDLF